MPKCQFLFSLSMDHSEDTPALDDRECGKETSLKIMAGKLAHLDRMRYLRTPILYNRCACAIDSHYRNNP